MENKFQIEGFSMDEKNNESHKLDSVANLERQTKHGELDTILLINRLNHPIIRKQIIDLLEAQEQSRKGKLDNYAVLDERGKLAKDESGHTITERRAYVPETRDEIERDFNRHLEFISSLTPIEFSEEQPNELTMTLGWKNPHTGV